MFYTTDPFNINNAIVSVNLQTCATVTAIILGNFLSAHVKILHSLAVTSGINFLGLSF